VAKRKISASQESQINQPSSPISAAVEQNSNDQYAVLAINPGHNGSAALVVNGELVFYGEEERFSRMKYDGNPFRAMLHALMNCPINELVIGGTVPQLPQMQWTGEDPYTALVRKFNPNVKVTSMMEAHHVGHASAAFYGSGFETAAAVIVDGSGSYYTKTLDGDRKTGGFETESIYKCAYPNEFVPVYKRYSDGASPYFKDEVDEFDSAVTITKAYEAVSYYLGFGFIEAGKTMGLAPYGTDDNDVPMFFVQNKGNKNLLIPQYPMGAFIDENRFPYLARITDPMEWHRDFSLARDQDKNIAYNIQKEAEEQVMRLIEKAATETGEKNIVLSGGFALNCVANYKFIKQFPNLNIYVDPIAHDGGTAIGLAKHAWHTYSGDTQSRPLKSMYLGLSPDYGIIEHLMKTVDGVLTIDATTSDDIADLIDQGNIVALFQGRPEGGPRALGNRSILFDPRRQDGKDIVNAVKHREWFRPFAGSVMEEHARDWFEMETLESSPFMMYAVDVNSDKAEQIPAVTHVDNTCRIQTVSREDNPNYYELIDAFYKKTGVPLLFNTSLNLAGQPLVETLADAVGILLNSQIEYLYLPEVQKLVKKVSTHTN
jgi:carbamoyltransferase